MFCWKCGAENKEGSNYCSKCGAYLSSGRTKPEMVVSQISVAYPEAEDLHLERQLPDGLAPAVGRQHQAGAAHPVGIRVGRLLFEHRAGVFRELELGHVVRRADGWPHRAQRSALASLSSRSASARSLPAALIFTGWNFEIAAANSANFAGMRP